MTRPLDVTGPGANKQDAVSRSVTKDNKEELAQATQEQLPAVDGAPHYGERFAETKARFQEKQKARYEEIHAEGVQERSTASEGASESTASTGDTSAAAQTEYPESEAAPAHLIEALVEEGYDRVRALTGSVGEVVTSTWQLIVFPRDAARLIMRKLRALRAG